MRKKKNMTTERRQPIDRQTAFVEFKGTQEAKQLETEILEARQNLKQKRVDLKGQTQNLNSIKSDIDQVKAFLD